MTSTPSSVPYVAWFDRNDEEKYASIANRKSKPETDTASDLSMPHEPESPTPIHPDHDAVCRALDPILHPSLSSRFVSLLKWFFTSPLLFAMIYALLTLYLNSIIQIFTERRVPDLPVLPDLGHDLLPRIEYWEICDYYAGTFAAATVLRILMLPKMRITILRRYLFFQGTLLFLRSFTIVMTSLPVPLPVCSNTATGNIFVEALLIMVLVHRTCADILFSGHTVNMMLMALIWTQYTNGEEFNCCIAPDRRNHQCHPWLYSKKSLDGDYRGWNIVKWFIWLVAITGCLIIIAARFHYTDDVAIAIFLTVLIWKFYHYYIKNVHTKDKTFLNRWLIWFEGIDADLLLALSTQMEATKQAIIDQRHRQEEIERERLRREQEEEEKKREEEEEKKKQAQDTSSSPSHSRRLVVNVANDTIINIPSEPIKSTSTRSSLPIVQRSNSSTQLPIARFTPDTHVELSPSPVVKLNRESPQINHNIKSS